jgi:hypothetical protein
MKILDICFVVEKCMFSELSLRLSRCRRILDAPRANKDSPFYYANRVIFHLAVALHDISPWMHFSAAPAPLTVFNERNFSLSARKTSMPASAGLSRVCRQPGECAAFTCPPLALLGQTFNLSSRILSPALYTFITATF